MQHLIKLLRDLSEQTLRVLNSNVISKNKDILEELTTRSQHISPISDPRKTIRIKKLEKYSLPNVDFITKCKLAKKRAT